MHLDIASMPIVPLFFCKLSLSLAVVWGFYQVVLRRLTFYSLNRWYLLGYALLSFFIPLINIGPMLPDGPAGEPVVLRFVPALGGVVRGAGAAASPVAGLSGWTVLLWVVAAGAVLLLLRLVVRWLSLVRLRRKATRLEGMGVRIYQVDGQVVPFSFGGAIYINKALHTEKEWGEIILHEYVHVRQKHSMDILIAELICVVNWYNPFAWLIRYSIRQNLEFIADREVLEKGVDRKGYQYHLLKVVGDQRYRLANNFNFSSLKKRIVMMNKMRSARVHLLKLLFLLPLVGVLLVAFRDRYVGLLRGHGAVQVNTAAIATSIPERTPPAGMVGREMMQRKARSGRPGAVGSMPRVSNAAQGRLLPQAGNVLRGGGVRVKDTVPADSIRQHVIVIGGLDSIAPLYIVDGKQMPPGWQVEAIPKDMLVSINVITIPRAEAIYGKRAVHGALQITSKDPGHDWSKDKIVRDGAIRVEGREPPAVRAVKLDSRFWAEPMVIIDGTNVHRDTLGTLSTLNPNSIESIQVLKDSAAVQKYGEKGKNGVVIIHLKDSLSGVKAPGARY